MAEEPEEAVEETPAEPEAASEEATASEAIAPQEAAPPADDETPPAEEEAPAPEAVPDSPKERRRRARDAKAAAVPTRPQRTAEERQQERDEERRRKAQVRRKRRQRERENARQAGAPTPAPLAPRVEQHPGQQKTRQGIVVSDRASKTITVRIDVTRRHPRYEKIVRTSRTLHAHDEKDEAHVGDTVIVRESRPKSRTKRWRLVQVVERAR